MSDLAKTAIARTLYEMLEKTPYDQITVTALIQECGISRSTFYYHFKDMDDLLEWCMITHFSKVLGKYKTYTTWPDGFLRILKEIYAEKDVLLRVVDYVDRSALEKALYDPVYHLLYDVLTEKAQYSKVSEEKKEFIADFYKYGFVGLVIGWIEGGFKETPEQLSDNLSHLMHGTFQNALKEFEKQTEDGVQLLVHIGIDTVNAKGDGFTICSHKQGDTVQAGDPIVTAALRKLGQNYDMSTMLIITNANGKDIHFIDPCDVERGQSVIR